ncbi:hypothetical protein BDQ12DRAFT_676677 [Crucibulum laeve]|uniref:Uncharacterized protein n=1 Tax=Crucibulum laeve TaxID=68775 RepID=A0A5C3MBY9_9AGAR|nr:hypothetical protein BDQ12DRAFT_676677 [Crucibulum laeve]
MSSGTTAQDKTWKAKEQSEEARYIHEKEQAQLAAIREAAQNKGDNKAATDNATGSENQAHIDRDFEGGFGGQEDLEDRYATTSGEH